MAAVSDRIAGRRPVAILASAGLALALGVTAWVTAPPPLLVDVPIYSGDQDDEFAGGVDAPVSAFYDTPDWQPAPAGTLVRAAPIADAPDGVRSWRILYHSTDLQGRDIPVSGVLHVPEAPPPDGGYPLVSFAHGTLGIGRSCGVSQAPFTPGTAAYTAWNPHFKPMVEHGWAVVATDYSGMGAEGPASYLVGPLEARGVLDAMRAVSRPDPRIGSLPMDLDRLGIYGKSQGGEAAISALELASSYAPELAIKGGVSLAPGFLPPIPGVIDFVAGNPTSTKQNFFTLLLIASFAANYPELTSLDAVLSETGKERIALTETLCSDALGQAVSDVPLSDLVKLPVDQGFVEAVSRGTPGATPIKAPLLVAQGLEDTTILPQLTHAQVMSRCALGDTVAYVTYPEDTHGSLNYQARLSPPYVLDWMDDRFDGVPVTGNCPNQVLGIGGAAR